jgi:hypothetical protein
MDVSVKTPHRILPTTTADIKLRNSRAICLADGSAGMASIVVIEIETAIRKISWASFQAGQKSLHSITVDFGSKKTVATYTTGHTKIAGFQVGSIRDKFLLIGNRFNGGGTALFTAVGETASAVGVMPNINYTFQLEVTPHSVKYSGTHDGYPSYKILVNGATIYDYVQGHIGQLLGSEDIEVKSTTFAIPQK